MGTHAYSKCPRCSRSWELSPAEVVATPVFCPRCQTEIHGHPLEVDDEEGNAKIPKPKRKAKKENK